MADISAADVKRLRDATGAPMMACKQALVDADGDFEEAADLVRQRTGAKMDERAAERTANEGLVHSYLHTPTPGQPAKIGVMVQLSCETDFVAKNDEFQRLAQDLALHIAFASPRFIAEDQVDETVVEREREYARREAQEQGKPENVIDRIVEGRVRALYEQQVLLNQKFVKDDQRTVGELVSDVQGKIGEKIQVARFARFEVGA